MDVINKKRFHFCLHKVLSNIRFVKFWQISFMKVKVNNFLTGDRKKEETGRKQKTVRIGGLGEITVLSLRTEKR